MVQPWHNDLEVRSPEVFGKISSPDRLGPLLDEFEVRLFHPTNHLS